MVFRPASINTFFFGLRSGVKLLLLDPDVSPVSEVSDLRRSDY